MFSPLLLMPALAGVMAAANNATTMVTVVKAHVTTMTGQPAAAASLSARWSGDCEEYCSHLWGNGYYPCMELCPQRRGKDTDTDHPAASDFIEPGAAPWEYVTTDSPSTSDQSDYHHKRGLEARNTDTDGEGEADGGALGGEGRAVVDELLRSVRVYAQAYSKAKAMRNAVRLGGGEGSLAQPVGEDVDRWIGEWLEGVRGTVARRGEAEAEVEGWSSAFVGQVVDSKRATGQYYARRLEVLARKAVEGEMRQRVGVLGREARVLVRREVRRQWMRLFGQRVWGPRNVMAAVDFRK